ncbi:MAG: hypothetical protein D3910_23560 [Candidatus Electrothrix sp. ATG2]|nr:hypothetical protein [Candidatus Electrothrix sp. ATG2]
MKQTGDEQPAQEQGKRLTGQECLTLAGLILVPLAVIALVVWGIYSVTSCKQEENEEPEC